jgi:hypothetical protein
MAQMSTPMVPNPNPQEFGSKPRRRIIGEQ